MTRISPAWLGWPETRMLMAAFGTIPYRFVGGCVRDAVLGCAAGDVDVATPLLPEAVMKLLTSAGIKVIPTGIDHGTVTAVVGKRPFEITTLRRDVTTDGRRATVAYTTEWREDAERRDFTMNALYSDANGEVTDYFQGIEDANTGHVRFIGDAKTRILEDGLRILRFFRFFALYGKEPMDANALAACTALASRIDMLSGERIQQEMFKLLVTERAAEVVAAMQRAGVLAHVLPCKVEPSVLGKLPDVLRKAEYKPGPVLALAALLRSANPTGAADEASLADWISQHWKTSKADRNHLFDLQKNVSVSWDEKQVKKLIRAWGKALFVERAILSMAQGADEKETLLAIALARRWEVPQFPVTGSDLLARGIHGKVLGEKLRELEALWEEGGYVVSKQELLSSLPPVE